MRSAEVLVVGGGLAGAAAAITLARAGREVVLLEREREPKHKVCGEFLSTEALHLLDGLGVSPERLGAEAIRDVRLCSGARVTGAALPFRALSLTRRRLDAEMLCAAEIAGAEVRRGVGVVALQRGSPGWQAELSDGEPAAAASAVVLASGKHDLRGFARPPGRQNDLVGLKMYWRLRPEQARALAGQVELLLHKGGYSGLQMVEDGQANLCSLVRRDVLAQAGGWEGLVALVRQGSAHADERLAGAEPLLARPLAVAAIPYGFVRRRALGEGLWAVGDQAAVIPSFTGDGMSIALYSGVRAAEALLRGSSSAAFQRELGRELQGQVARATVVSLALVQDRLKLALVGAVRLWPGLLRGTAVLTRLPAMTLAGLSL